MNGGERLRVCKGCGSFARIKHEQGCVRLEFYRAALELAQHARAPDFVAIRFNRALYDLTLVDQRRQKELSTYQDKMALPNDLPSGLTCPSDENPPEEENMDWLISGEL